MDKLSVSNGSPIRHQQHFAGPGIARQPGKRGRPFTDIVAPHDGADGNLIGVVCVLMELFPLWQVERDAGGDFVFIQSQHSGQCGAHYARYHVRHILVYDLVFFLEDFE